ncbi:hypothetical protein FOA52_012923 [Chlamydomonas sp. UWO 241]|nr:hypothetical protein FOA52_012923 [Chlamydomonas sp. UWO 241]
MQALRSSTSVRAQPRSRASAVTVRAGNIMQTAAAKGHTSFVAAVEAAGLASTLNGAGPFTVFVPTNAAFAAYDGKDPHTGNKISVVDTCLYHVVGGKVQSRHLENNPNIRSMADIRFAALQVNLKAKKGSVLMGSPQQGVQGLAGLPTGGFVTAEKDIVCDNGLIHVVDGVFKPQEPLPGNNGSGSAGKSAAW